jgi:hypothetical protein
MGKFKAKEPKWIRGWEHWQCGHCREWKRRSGFQNLYSRLNGLAPICRVCCANKDRRDHATNPEKARAANKRWRQANKEQRLEYFDQYRFFHKDRLNARRYAKEAIGRGDIIRPLNCECCGNPCLPDAHHDSYDQDRWLVVTFMCKPCHGWTHAKRREQNDLRT